VRIAPNGTRIEIVDDEAPPALPPWQPRFVVARAAEARWVEGRAGMRYRDLIPGRLGGWLIASAIEIAHAGPVPDYVHHHDVRFQAIHCRRGWVRLVYEDAGPPFVLAAGDTVLQPPHIRHRVLESSDGLEVIEIASPAAHVTAADHEMTLPTPEVRPAREWSGQRFTLHRAAEAVWHARDGSSFEAFDTGIAAATNGLAGVCVVRGTQAGVVTDDDALLFMFVLDGTATIDCEGQGRTPLTSGDAVVVPPAHRAALTPDGTLTYLEVTVSMRCLAGGVRAAGRTRQSRRR